MRVRQTVGIAIREPASSPIPMKTVRPYGRTIRDTARALGWLEPSQPGGLQSLFPVDCARRFAY
jgi:hypothetical protein